MARAVVLLVALLLLFLTATCADSSGSENLKRKQPDADDYATKLRAAVLEGNFYNVERALEKGADVNGASTTGVTPLMIAAYKGEEHIIRFLLEKGADIDKQDYRGQTALIVASHKGDPDIVRVLLDGDPNLDLRTKGGWWSSGETALEVAERSGHLRSWATVKTAKPT
jgi:ankyrin repeat protein